MTDLLARVDLLRSGRTPFVLATVVRAERPTSARPGDRAVVLPDGTVEGFVGGACAESTVRLEGLRLLRDGTSTLLRITPAEAAASHPDPVEGMITVDNPCLSGGTLEIFLEAVVPPTVVVVLGDGPVARALARVGGALDHDVRPLAPGDPVDIPEGAAAVVAASHGRGEEELLSAALAAGVPYVALVASRRRGTAVLDALEALDVGPTDRARVHTPAGLDLGARTPGEVALSIWAELVAARGDRTVPGPAVPRATEAPDAVDPICGMSVARVPGTPNAVVEGDHPLVLRRGLPAGVPRRVPMTTDVEGLRAALDAQGYLADESLATALFLATAMGQPILLEGEPGVGKTQAALALAAALDSPLLRLQCYEGLTASEALYEWNYPRQLLAIRLAESRGEALRDADLFTDDYLLARPLLAAVQPPGSRVRRSC